MAHIAFAAELIRSLEEHTERESQGSLSRNEGRLAGLSRRP